MGSARRLRVLAPAVLLVGGAGALAVRLLGLLSVVNTPAWHGGSAPPVAPSASGGARTYYGRVQIAQGDNHACVLWQPSGVVACYGDEALGAPPLPPLGDEDRKKYECVLRTLPVIYQGQVGCDREASPEQLQRGCRLALGAPFWPEPTDTSTITQVVAGRSFSCALTSEGTVRCWGRVNHPRHLDYGAKNPATFAASAPTADVPVGGRVAQLAAGRAHVCARLETGAVRCWGSGARGALGYGTARDVGADEAPARAGDVPIGGKVVQLAAGPEHTCALLENGAVRCWGNASRGRLGYGATRPARARPCESLDPLAGPNGCETRVLDVGDDETPASVGDVPVGGKVAQLVAGRAHTCALLEGGAVRCWGDGSYGGLGYGAARDVGADEAPARAGDVPIGGKVVQLAAGSGHTCALLEGGAVRCWGHDSDEALGDRGPAARESLTPERRGDVSVGGRAVGLAAGGQHTCAFLDTGAMRCWGAGRWLRVLGYPASRFGSSHYKTPSELGDAVGPAAPDRDLER